MKCHLFLVAFILLPIFNWVECTRISFDDNIKFGIATAAYQIEGAWDTDGKGLNIWDYYTHNTTFITDNSTADIACDSYNQYEVDIELMKQMGVQQHRFSIAWARILPTGRVDNINQKGLEHYNNFINALLAAGIEPVVTMYHWDHPRTLELLGGWNQPNMVTYMKEYADLLFFHYGDRVKIWITLNEPHSLCVVIAQALASLVDSSVPIGTTEYMCGHTMLLAHTEVWALYQKKYQKKQRGQIGIALSIQSYIPATDSVEDKLAVERIYEHALGWFLNPLVFGDYPEGMKNGIRRYSFEQGFPESRLPRFTKEQKKKLRKSFDFIGLNNYIAYLVLSNTTVDQSPSYNNDCGATTYEDPEWSDNYEEKIKVYVDGFRNTLLYVKNCFDNPLIIVSEQGYSNDGTVGLNDTDRVFYFESALKVLWKAINVDGVNISSYFMWSLMDDFEWVTGYTPKLGLYSVNFTDPERTRVPKESAKFVTSFLKNKTLIVSEQKPKMKGIPAHSISSKCSKSIEKKY